MHNLKRIVAAVLAGAMFFSPGSSGFAETFREIEMSIEAGAEQEEASDRNIGRETEEGSESDTESAETEELDEETLPTDGDKVEEGTEYSEKEEPDETDEENSASDEGTEIAEDKSEAAAEQGDSKSEGSENEEDESTEELTEKASEEENVGVENAGEENVEEASIETEEDADRIELLPTFEAAIPGVSTAGIDFSSRQLLIGTEDPGIFTWDTVVLSEYRGVYLTEYRTVEETRNAYTYYYGKADFVSGNATFTVSDQAGNAEEETGAQGSSADEEEVPTEDDEESHISGESADLPNLNEGDDALSNLNNMDATRTPDRTIALIDTGINDGSVIDAVSVIGDSAFDDNGHGTRMYQAIREEYPDARILSIKAMGSDGKGQASDIYAAIQYALESHVDVINLSLTANGTGENSVVVRAIEEAIGKGVTVVGAAGNNASNAKYFIPGCVEDAYIIGAANEKGDRLSDSNYGPNVDYEVIADSTSEAAARFSALYMRSKAEGKDVTDYPNVLINYDRTDLSTDDYVLLYNNDDFNVSRAAASKAISVKIGDKTYKINIPSYLVFPINVNATDTSKYYGFAGYRDASKAKDYLGSKTFNAATGMMATGSGDSETTYASITKSCGTYFNVQNTVAGLPDGDFKKAYGSDATAHGASDVCVYGSSPNYNTTATGWTTNWYNNGYRVITSNSSDLYSFSVFCTEAKDMSPRGAYGQLIMLPITSTNTRGYANYKVTVENNQTYVWVPYRSDEVDQNAYSGHSNWQNFIGGTYLKVPYTEEADYYIGISKKNDSGDPMKDITFDVKVNGTVTAKALKTGADGIVTYKVGKFAEAPKVEVQENWTNERFKPESTGFYGVTVYEKEADARTHAKDAKHTWTNDRYEYYASIMKDGNEGISSKGFAGAYYGLYDTNVKANMTDDHLIAVFEMDKDGYACNLYGATTSTVAGHICKARLNYTEDTGWKVSRTVNGHTQYFICMGKDSLTDKKMLTDTKFAYKELIAPDGYLLTEDPITATITKLLEVPTTLTSTQVVSMIDEDWENSPTYIYLEKRSANTRCTDGNPNYSLAGATYKVFTSNADASSAVTSRDFSRAIGTLTVNGSGNSQTLEVTEHMNINSKTGKFESTRLYIVESVTGKGYEMDKTVHTLTVEATNSKDDPATLKVTDIPVNDPIRIRVVKNTKNGTGTGVAGAKFTVKHYSVSVDTTESFKTLQSKSADIVEEYTTDKDGEFTVFSDDTHFAIGYLTIEETSAPAGYRLEGATATAKGVSIPVKMCFRLLADGNTTDGYKPGKAYLLNEDGGYMTGNDGERITAADIDSVGNDPLTISVDELPKRGDLVIEKHGESDEPLANIRFEVKSEATGEVHYLVTDADGKVSTHKDYVVHSKDTNKYDDVKASYAGNAGTWFSLVVDKNHSQKVTDEQGALPEGWYQVKEIDSQGHQKEEMIRAQVKDGQITNVYDSNRGDEKTYITNVKLPTMESDAWIVMADGSLVKVSSPEKDMTIRDQVSYTNLRFNTKYSLVGKLMEIQADGSVKEIAKASKSFETAKTYVRSMYECCGDLTLDFEHLDLSNAAGGGYVVFQYIYLGDEKSGYTSYKNVYPDSNNDVVVFPLAHDDPGNERQTVSFMGRLRVHKKLNIEGDASGAVYEVRGADEDNKNYVKRLMIKKDSETDGYSDLLILPFGSYTVKEVEVPATGEWVIDPNTYTVELAANSGTITIDSELKGKASDVTIESREVAKTFAVLTKASSDPAFVEGNPNYSLAGAEYKLYADKAEADTALKSKDYSKAIGTFITDENGNADIIEVTEAMNGADEKAFYVVESKAAKNYLRRTVVSETVVKKDNTRKNPAKFEVTDEPVKIPVELLIEKVDQLSDTHDTAKGYSLAGAEFEVISYGDDITTINKADALSVNAKKTTLKITEDAKHFTAKVGAKLPIGYITIRETVIPENFDKKGSVWHIGKRNVDVADTIMLVLYGTYGDDNAVFTPAVYDPDQAATADELTTKGHAISDGANVSLTAQNTELRGNLSLHKVDLNTGKPMEGVKFEVKNQETGEVHYIYTNSDGIATTKADSYVKENYYDKVSDYDGTISTVWFAQGNEGSIPSKDGAAALPLGKYLVTEKRCKANKDYQMNPPQEVEITKDVLYVSIQNDKDGNFYNVPKPTFGTVATVIMGEDPDVKMVPATAGQTLLDDVIFSNLKVSTEYTLVGHVMQLDEEGNASPFLQNGNEVIAIKSFTTRDRAAEDKSDYCVNGTETVEFEDLDFTGLQDKKFVIYETLFLGNVTEGEVLRNYPEASPESEDLFPIDHKDPKDENQQVYTPNGETEAEDISGSKTVTYTDTVTLVDHVRYRNLQPGREYMVTGTLHVRPEDAPENAVYSETELAEMILKDEKGNPVTAQATFVATEANGVVDVTFTFRANLLTKEAETIVVFEDCFDKNTGVKVFTHSDIHDQGQTVFHPVITTTAMDENGRRELAHFSRKFYDVVSYDNLEAGRKYKLVGVAMDKNTGEELILDDVKVTAEDIFTTGEANKKNGAVQGSFKLEFTLTEEMQADLEGKDMVIFETLYAQYGKEWRVAAEHKDLSDEGQELKVPTLKTTLLDKATRTHVAYPDQIVTLVDTVVYTNLIPGKKYTMEGMLMKQPKGGDNQEIFKDKAGKPVTATKDFVASETGDGVVELEFTFNAKELFVEGKSVVAFETCLPEGDLIPVATHANIHDKDQTVDFPKVGTKAALVKKDVTENTASFEVTDQIMLTNLNTEYSYTAKGWLVDQKGNKVEIGGKAIEAEKTFTVENPNGSVDVTFPEFTVDRYDSFNYVVYEEVYVNVPQEDGSVKQVLIGEHKDLADSNQTVTYKDHKQPQTGDETPIAIFIGLLVLALAGIGVIIWRKRKLK
ncbi:MAG: VaFE repeat-containing surface-anchored protein [Eubacterium sp.]|nr:VaFE repeat-containing surface-anchored protein [Eubacterium sp.]